MRIGVISDTHSDMASLRRAISCIGDADAWFHLGDVASDILKIQDELNAPVYAVCGNCDFVPCAPLYRVEELGGKRFFLTHGHEFAVRTGTGVLTSKAAELHCDAAIYGHTHIPLTEYGGVWVLNPGSVAKPLGSSVASCAIITIENDKMKFDIINV